MREKDVPGNPNVASGSIPLVSISDKGVRLAPGSLFLWGAAGRPRVDPGVEEVIRDALACGDKGMQKIAREMGVGVSVVQRVKMECLPGGLLRND